MVIDKTSDSVKTTKKVNYKAIIWKTIYSVFIGLWYIIKTLIAMPIFLYNLFTGFIGGVMIWFFGKLTLMFVPPLIFIGFYHLIGKGDEGETLLNNDVGPFFEQFSPANSGQGDFYFICAIAILYAVVSAWSFISGEPLD